MPPQKPLPTSTDAIPDLSITSQKLADGAIGEKLGTDISAVIAAHALEDIVQNTGTKPILVVVSGTINMPATNDAASAELLIESANPPTVAVCQNDAGNANLADISCGFTLMGIVLPGQFYKVAQINTVGTGIVTIDKWAEYTL